jgi:hypothetical protein
MALKDICWDGVDSIYVAEDEDTIRAVTNTVMNLWFSKKYGNFLSSPETSFWYVTPFSLDDMYLRVRETSCLHFFSANKEASDFFKALARTLHARRQSYIQIICNLVILNIFSNLLNFLITFYPIPRHPAAKPICVSRVM